ncbi:hypothetical protein SVAN01_02905 [Stagonosporopsis vannaccii]|nr:hypothetical protein SVAN01_02905 [Stagonosporopsis vannaccii]
MIGPPGLRGCSGPAPSLKRSSRAGRQSGDCAFTASGRLLLHAQTFVAFIERNRKLVRYVLLIQVPSRRLEVTLAESGRSRGGNRDTMLRHTQHEATQCSQSLQGSPIISSPGHWPITALLATVLR